MALTGLFLPSSGLDGLFLPSSGLDWLISAEFARQRLPHDEFAIGTADHAFGVRVSGFAFLGCRVQGVGCRV